MATRHLEIGRWALWFSPIVIAPVAFFALGRPGENDVFAFAWGIYVMGYSVFLAARVNRRFDEVQIAGQRFAQTKGMTIGTIAGALVMSFPPSMSALMDLANTVGAGSPDKAVRTGIGIGFMLVVVLQAVVMVAVSFWWERRVFGGRA